MDANRTEVDDRKGYRGSREGIAGEHSPAIDALFAAFDRPSTAGANVAVIKSGKTIHRRGYGVANIENDTPFAANTRSQIGSTTKHFCATAVLMLEDRGQLSLSDGVRKFVPEMPAFMDAITLRHLLSMTSGLPDGLNFPLFAGLPEGGNISRAAHLEILTRLTAPMFAPGAGMTYSNSNYLLLSRIIERLGSMPLGDFMQQNIFAPLGMNDTALLSDTTTALPNKATGYVPGPGGKPRRANFAVELCGDGGIVSTLDDMTKWLLHYRDATLVPRFRERLESETKLINGRSIAYRLGITSSLEHGRRKIAHGGGMPGYLCDFAYYPDDDLGVIQLINWMDPTLFEKTDAIAHVVCGTTAPSPQTSELPAGAYVSFTHGYAAALKQEDGRAVLYMMGERLPLQCTGPGTFEPTKDSVVCPLRVTDRSVEGGPLLQVQCGTVEPVLFEPTGEDAALLADRAEFEGRYRSALLHETHIITRENGEFCIRLDSALCALLWTGLKPRGRDVFSATFADEPGATDITLIFRRDANGQICAFEYNTFRTRGLVFERLP